MVLNYSTYIQIVHSEALLLTYFASLDSNMYFKASLGVKHEYVVKIYFFDFAGRYLKVQPCNLKNYSVMISSI